MGSKSEANSQLKATVRDPALKPSESQHVLGCGNMVPAKSVLLAAAHDFAGVFVAVDNIDPATEGPAVHVIA